MNGVHLVEITVGACGSSQEVLRGKQERSEILRKQTGVDKRFCRSEQKPFGVCVGGVNSQSTFGREWTKYLWERMVWKSVDERGRVKEFVNNLWGIGSEYLWAKVFREFKGGSGQSICG